MPLAVFLAGLAYAAPTSPPNSTIQKPVLVDSFSPAELIGVDLPVYGSILWPYGLAAKKDGTLLVACGSTVLAMDRRWQVTGLPAKKLGDEGNMLFAYMIFLTTADTMYLRSTDGSGLWSIPDGSAEYRRIRSEGQPGSAFGVLDDGSTFTLEGTDVRVSRNGLDSRFKLPEGVSAMAAGAGPDDTIWIPDLVGGNILVFSPGGRELRRIKTDVQPGTILMKIRVQRDGGFIGVTNTDVRRFDSSGRTLWSWDGRDEGVSVMFSTFTDVAAAGDGILYINDFMGKRILRLTERPAALPADLKSVAAAAKALRVGGDKPELALVLADAYERMGATEAARIALARYLDERPADAKAQDRRLRLETSLRKAKAAAAGSDATELLGRFGAETARDAYGRAMRTWEALRASVGDDEEIRSAMGALRSAFQAAERGAAAAAPSPKVVATEIAALFPSLLRAYRTRPAGAVVLMNTLQEPIRNVRADLFIRKYMDFPAEGTVLARLEPGKEASLNVFALLNEAALEVQEDLPLQAQLTVHYTDARGEHTVEISRPVTLYRRTAISWDDTGKLAAFITPNEDTVAGAAFKLLGTDGILFPVSRTFASAARLCDSLGALPLSYVKDPQSPIEAVLGASGSIDTVRFPRTTLAYRGGDCDDTTALLASLLEALGISTAIMTSPGHVFLAFDSGEPEANAWMFNAPGFRTVTHKGTLWIPVESTVLSDGFADAWRAASELVERYSASRELGFLATAEARSIYPPLPLPPSILPSPTPDAVRLDTIGKRSLAILDADLYKPAAKVIEGERKKQSGATWNRTGNRLAQLHARFGHDSEAAAVLNAIAAKDPSYVPALLNLAGLAQKAGRKDESVAWLRRAASMSPGSTVVAGYARAIGYAEALGFGPAIVDVPKGEAPAGAGTAASTDRAAGPAGTGWVGD
jgi:tetratricopeptide (TPR) repeat protein